MRQLQMVRFMLAFGLAALMFSSVFAAPTPADKSFESAKQFAKVGNDQQAADEFQYFLKTFPNDQRCAQAAFLLGFSFQKLQKHDKALEAYGVVFAKAPGEEMMDLRARTHFQMGVCYLLKADYTRAERSYSNFLILHTRMSEQQKEEVQTKEWKEMLVESQYRRAECLYRLDRRDEAFQEYNKVLTLSPTDPLAAWACYMMGVIKVNQGDYSRAIGIFEKFTKEYSASELASEASLELGVAYLGRARTQQGAAEQAADYQRAIALLSAASQAKNVTPDGKQQAVLSLATAYYETGDLAKSEASYALALTLLDPASELAQQARMQRAHVLFTAKRYDEARKEYARVGENKKSTALATEALFWLGNCAFEQAGKKDVAAYREAVSALSRFLAQAGDKEAKAPQAALLLGYCYEDLAILGDKEAAQKALDTFGSILKKWRDSNQAPQAQDGIIRLSQNLTPEQLKLLASSLPPGNTAWDLTLQIAHKEFTAKNYDKALEAAKKVLDNKPEAKVKAQAAYLAGASLHRIGGRTAEAVPYYQQVITAAPGGELLPYARHALVQAYLELKDYANARDAALELLKLDPIAKTEPEVTNEKAERQMYLAMAYVGNKQVTEAQAVYRKLVTDFPKATAAPSALFNLAQLAEKTDMRAAVAMYQEFVVKFPEHPLVPDIFLLLGADLLSLKEYDQAINAYKNVPQTSKLADQAAYAIALAYKNQGKEAEAVAQFLLLTEKFPKSQYAADSWYRVGESQMTAKKYPEAIASFKKSLEALPAGDTELGPLATYNLASCAFFSEQYAVAAEYFGKVAEKYAANEHAAASLFWRGQALEKQGGDAPLKAARDAYARYGEKYPAGDFAADAAVGVGRAALASKQYAVARTDLTKAADICAKLEKSENKTLADRAKNLGGEIQYLTALTYLEEKDYERARREFAAVSLYKLEPWFSLSQLATARCDALLGNKENAAKTLNYLIRNHPNTEGAQKAPALAEEFGLKL